MIMLSKTRLTGLEMSNLLVQHPPILGHWRGVIFQPAYMYIQTCRKACLSFCEHHYNFFYLKILFFFQQGQSSFFHDLYVHNENKLKSNIYTFALVFAFVLPGIQNLTLIFQQSHAFGN